MIIQVVLVAGILAVGTVFVRDPASGSRTAVRRLLGLGAVPVAVLAVLFPNATNWLARQVGVTRGADLLLYVSVLAFVFSIVAVHQRIRALESRMVALTRELALLTGRGAPEDALR
ncbi:MAG: DUF2304 domain-containing protein [Marmoricola sp.]